jgi:hypothetical protein
MALCKEDEISSLENFYSQLPIKYDHHNCDYKSVYFQHFHDIAYKAISRDELLHAINEFLDESIVLPPGDWDQKTLLPIMDMARKKARAMRRKKHKEEEKIGQCTEGQLSPKLLQSVIAIFVKMPHFPGNIFRTT